MAANTKLAVAIHAAAVLACKGDEWVTSDLIASSVNTNPVVVRRILCALTKAGIVESHVGKSGGSKLAKCPSRITLADIYAAVMEDGLFAEHGKPENKGCAVSCFMKEALGKLFTKAERGVVQSLKGTTLADLVRPVTGGCASKR
jgi:Rrf2 family protein